MSLALLLQAMQPAALVLLAVFVMACLVFLPRECNFIRSAGKRWQVRFIIQDLLIIASMLLVLLPCTMTAKLSKAMLFIVLSGFTLLWAAVLWAAFARYAYVRQLLTAAGKEGLAKLQKLERESKEEHDAD